MTDPYLDDVPEGRIQFGFLKKLWPFVRPYRRGFLACLVILIVSFGLEMLGPWVLARAIDGPMRGHGEETGTRVVSLLWYCAAFFGTTALGALLGYYFGMLTAWNGQRVIRDVRAFLYSHLLRTGLPFHEKNPAGKLTTRITSDVENLNELIATGVLQSVFDLLKIVGVLVAMFFLDLHLALFTLASTPVVVLISMLFRRNAQRAYRAVRGRLALQNAFTTELIGGVRTTRAFGREAAVAQRYAERNHETALAWRATVLHFSVFFALVDFALRATTVGLLWYGGSAVLEGRLLPGQFVQFWLYYGMFSGPVKELGEKYNVLQAAFASCERVFQLLAEPQFPPPDPDARPSRRAGAARIEFDHVTFAYREGAPVLRDVSFTVQPGQTIAIVGPTGAGKTTLLSLVARLRDVTAGRDLIDGLDVRNVQLASLRARIAFVAQDLFLFTGSVLDNVRLFDRRIGEPAVWRALETVGAAEFVRRMPQGLQTGVEERGALFSQGERQLLAFARALVVEPDLLVLDEATASIDSETERKLQQALVATLRGRTALVVAHRLSTVQNADRILVIEHGGIVESGPHAELVKKRGVYWRMLSQVDASS